MATNLAALEQASRNESGSRWYRRDLPKYGAGLFVIAFMYVCIRIYQGAFALETGLDSTMPVFDVYWRRLLYIEIVVEVALGIGIASPVHYAFVISVCFALALGGTILQMVMRMAELLDKLESDASGTT